MTGTEAEVGPGSVIESEDAKIRDRWKTNLKDTPSY